MRWLRAIAQAIISAMSTDVQIATDKTRERDGHVAGSSPSATRSRSRRPARTASAVPRGWVSPSQAKINKKNDGIRDAGLIGRRVPGPLPGGQQQHRGPRPRARARPGAGGVAHGTNSTTTADTRLSSAEHAHASGVDARHARGGAARRS